MAIFLDVYFVCWALGLLAFHSYLLAFLREANTDSWYGAGVDEEPKGVLSIHKESGIVYVHKAVDYKAVWSQQNKRRSLATSTS